jgi:hypothetical protein
VSNCTHNELIEFTKASYTIAIRSLPSYSSRFSNRQCPAVTLRPPQPDKAAAAHLPGSIPLFALLPEIQEVFGLEQSLLYDVAEVLSTGAFCGI